MRTLSHWIRSDEHLELYLKIYQVPVFFFVFRPYFAAFAYLLPQSLRRCDKYSLTISPYDKQHSLLLFPSACLTVIIFFFMGGHTQPHVFWCCQAHFNISKAATLMRRRERQPSLMGVRLSMLRCRAVESFIISLFFSCSPALWCLWAPAQQQKHLNGSHTCYISWGRFIFLNACYGSRGLCVYGGKNTVMALVFELKSRWEQMLTEHVIAMPRHVNSLWSVQRYRECWWFLYHSAIIILQSQAPPLNWSLLLHKHLSLYLKAAEAPIVK